MATSLELFRTLVTEFTSINDETVLTWLDITTPFVSRKYFGNLYQQALVYLTAHRMKTGNVGNEDSIGDSDFSDIGGVGTAFKVSGYGSGGENISFNSGILTAQLSPDAEFTQTAYGVQYLSIRKLCSTSIINSGER